jgi:hypothetical protein
MMSAWRNRHDDTWLIYIAIAIVIAMLTASILYLLGVI